ncbi:Uncharacterised protein [Vibrio cholerae]|nr:Uncharacterised protein [Vibrio cholerae]CSD17312.1 Uncharacterised protein [Vibrio cholerae]
MLRRERLPKNTCSKSLALKCVLTCRKWGRSRLIKWIGMRLKTTISSALMSIKWLRLTS